MSRLLIVQGYVPEYRVPFFRDLRSSLAPLGIEVHLVAGEPRGDLALRGDAASPDVVDAVVRQTYYPRVSASLSRKDLRGALRTYRPDAVIVEQALKNLETYPLLARTGWRGGPRVGMWGHGRTYSTAQSPRAAATKDWLTRRSDWFFAYTQDGGDYLAQHGYDPERITVVNNTIDTVDLSAHLSAVAAQDVATFRARHGLVPGRTAIFIGGVDEAKGMTFLLDAANRVAASLPGFTLLVGGSGASAGLVRERQAAGDPVVYLGRLDGADKALALSASDVMLVPQWVGLVAVDSLVAGKPILTTRHASHSPEFAYLLDGHNAVVTAHASDEYAYAVVSLLQDRDRLAALQAQAQQDAGGLSLGAMVGRFASGVEAWLGRPAGA